VGKYIHLEQRSAGGKRFQLKKGIHLNF